MSDAQRQYMLRQQLKAIQSELGESDSEVQELRRRVAEASLPEAVNAVAEREVGRLERMTPASPEYQMIRTYLDWLLEIPWAVTTEDRLDPVEARRVLDEDHYDLDKVKERIVEYLAVRKLKGDMKGPILCFSGAAGRRQDVARPVDRAGNEPQVRANLARRRPRRGGDPRPPPDLHRRNAGATRYRVEAGGRDQPRADARRDRQDQRRHSGRSRGRAARGARPGAESIRSATTTSRSRSTSRRCCSSRRPTSSVPSIPRSSTGWKSSRSAGTPSRRRCTSRGSIFCRGRSQSTGSSPSRSSSRTRRSGA